MYRRWDDTHKREAYTCEHWPTCRASMGVHPRSGKPLGIPGDYLTRQKRMQAHALFDRLWRNGGMRRPAAYAWMQEQMGLDERTGHISMMNAEQCDQLIAILQRRLEREYLSRMGGVPVPEDA